MTTEVEDEHSKVEALGGDPYTTKPGPLQLHKEQEQSYHHKEALFKFLKKYLVGCSAAFILVVITSCFHFKHFYLDDIALRIIAGAIPLQATGLILWVVRYYFPNKKL